MIHIEISVEPHYHETTWSADLSKLAPGSLPPHVILKRSFNTVDEAKQYIDRLGVADQHLHEVHGILDAADEDYVQVEIPLYELTGQLYTKASMAIEGQGE